MHGEAIELAGEPNREIGDVDAFLHLTDAFGTNLPAFERDQLTKRFDLLAKGIADETNDLTSLGCWKHGPLRLHGASTGHHLFVRRTIFETNRGGDGPCSGIDRVDRIGCAGGTQSRVVGDAGGDEDL